MTAPLPILSEHRLALDPRTFDRALSCVHCGLCLPACPTYTQNGHEADSPRGRIQLMRGLAEGTIDPTASVREHLDLCLDCRACETACPSGVVYHELIEETRSKLAATAKLGLQDRFLRWVFFHIFTKPTRLKLTLLPVRLMQKVGMYGLLQRAGVFKLLPLQLRKMQQMLPIEGRVWPARLPPATRGMGYQPMSSDEGKRHGLVAHATIGFFAGCIGSVLYDEVNRKAVQLLAAAGADVLVPHAQVCCGAIHHDNGAHGAAQELARRNIDAFLPKDGPAVDRIVTNIAGCGAMLREYDLLLRDDREYAARAKAFADRVEDISEALVDLLPPDRIRYPVEETVTYHDACHLAHAQKVTIAPRELLGRIPGLILAPLAESDMCCGAAGTYNLTQPRMAGELAARKLGHIAATGCKVCVTGNVGCALQIQAQAIADKLKLVVMHPVELLHRAVFGSGERGACE